MGSVGPSGPVGMLGRPGDDGTSKRFWEQNNNSIPVREN